MIPMEWYSGKVVRDSHKEGMENLLGRGFELSPIRFSPSSYDNYKITQICRSCKFLWSKQEIEYGFFQGKADLLPAA
jgi:hypothetical protein